MLNRTKIAVCFTTLYLVGVVIVVWFRGAKLFGLDLNELGDFVAGAFGPLALAWLIFGYLQQGDELRQGTEALKIQGAELRNSVEQQQRLAEISLQTLLLEQEQRSAQEKRYRSSLRPILALGRTDPSTSNGLYVAECDLYNDGAQIYSVEIYSIRNGTRKLCVSHRTLNKGDAKKVNVVWDPKEPGGDLLIDILYLEQDSTACVARFKAIPADDFGSIMFSKDEQFSS